MRAPDLRAPDIGAESGRLFHPLPTGIRDSAAAAVLLSAAVHAGAIAWGVSGMAERTMPVDAGAATVIEVSLVQGPADDGGAAGGAPSQPALKPSSDPAPAPVVEDATADRAVAADRLPSDAVVEAPPAADPPGPEAAPVPRPKPPPPAIARAIAETPATAEPVPPAPATPATPAPAQQAALPRGDAAAAGDGGGAPGSTGGAAEGAAPRADNPAPVYPFAARRRGQEGRVVLDVEVLPDGGAGTVSVTRTSGVVSLDRAALEAVRRWRFRPARRDGRPVRSTVRVPVRFALK
jgi:protein TonB